MTDPAEKLAEALQDLLKAVHECTAFYGSENRAIERAEQALAEWRESRPKKYVDVYIDTSALRPDWLEDHQLCFNVGNKDGSRRVSGPDYGVYKTLMTKRRVRVEELIRAISEYSYD